MSCSNHLFDNIIDFTNVYFTKAAICLLDGQTIVNGDSIHADAVHLGDNVNELECQLACQSQKVAGCCQRHFTYQ